MRKFNRFLPLVLSALLLSACQGTDSTPSENSTSSAEENTTTVQESSSKIEETFPSEAEDTTPSETEPESSQGMYVDFTDGLPDGFECSNGWTNGSMFNVTWRAKNVTFNDGKMQLIVDNDDTPSGGIPYSGGEFRSKDFYGYGRYEVSMKAIKNDGIVSSFFTYTGPSDNNPWDEIDIEILGKDTTKVQFNYFTDGKGEHEYMHDLGFDASEDFHTYAFEWHEDKIIWFVDDVEVHSVTESIPVTEGKIMMNAWCGIGVDSWLNAFNDENVPLTAEYQWIKFTPFDE